jgi:2-methylisocitrate lyase-like PEP mutase family enzyme
LIHDPGPGFRALHRPGGPFILANAWDPGSARLLAALGAEAIGTTSAGFAFTRGLPDGARITRDEALAHAQDLVAASPLPVSADLENGYASDPEGVAETVRLAEEAGLAGLSIEDTDLPGTAAYPFDHAVERVRAAVSAARTLRRDMVLVARADGVMNGAYDLAEGLRRLRAFEKAGADCLYLPLPRRSTSGADLPLRLPPGERLAAGPLRPPLARRLRRGRAWRASRWARRSPAPPTG